jgi:protein-tyrosine sulfotransferase
LARRPTLDRSIYADSALSADQSAHLAACTRSVQKIFDDRSLLAIFGVMPRCGTNFLYELLIASGACARPGIGFAEIPVLAGEDYFAEPTELIGRVHRESALAFSRMEWMAYGIGGFRNRLLDIAEPGSITVIKNPVVWNIELWPLFFPQDRAIFIQRDARYIVDSFQKTFARRSLSRSFEDICIETALAIDKSMAFLASQPDHKLLTLRYEDLVRDRAGALRRIAEWHGGIDSDALAAAPAMPIYGSSTHSRRDSKGAVDWSPVTPDASFNPAERPLEWSRSRQRLFERHCGEQNRRLGYSNLASPH